MNQKKGLCKEAARGAASRLALHRRRVNSLLGTRVHPRAFTQPVLEILGRLLALFAQKNVCAMPMSPASC